MRTPGSVMLITWLAVAVSLPAAAQTYEPPKRPNAYDVYCSGFVASQRLPADLQIVTGEGAVGRLMYTKNDYVYLSQGQNGGLREGSRYLVVRPMRDPNTVEAFDRQLAILDAVGTLYKDVGRVRLHHVHERGATALVEETCEALHEGDILTPFEERPVPRYKPAVKFDKFRPPSGKAQATVLLGKEFQHTMGQSDPIYVNLGSNQGVQVGDYYTLFRSGHGTMYEGFDDLEALAGRVSIERLRGIDHEIPDPDDAALPREVLGEALVVHVDRDSSTAIVTTSLREIHAGDFVEVQEPPQPQADLTAFPPSIVQGQSAVLSWEALAAQEAVINPGIGSVDFEGTAEVTPRQTTTYTLSVQGRGGTAQAQATVTVEQPPPPPPPPPEPPEVTAPSLEELFEQQVEDVFFAFDKANLTAQAVTKLERTARFLREHPEARVLIEGHADEIGTEDYNLRLGTRRAEAARTYLVNQGVSPQRLEIITLGETRPFCTESSEDWCRSLNRRAHFVLQR